MTSDYEITTEAQDSKVTKKCLRNSQNNLQEP